MRDASSASSVESRPPSRSPSLPSISRQRRLEGMGKGVEDRRFERLFGLARRFRPRSLFRTIARAPGQCRQRCNRHDREPVQFGPRRAIAPTGFDPSRSTCAHVCASAPSRVRPGNRRCARVVPGRLTGNRSHPARQPGVRTKPRIPSGRFLNEGHDLAADRWRRSRRRMRRLNS